MTGAAATGGSVVARAMVRDPCVDSPVVPLPRGSPGGVAAVAEARDRVVVEAALDAGEATRRLALATAGDGGSAGAGSVGPLGPRGLDAVPVGSRASGGDGTGPRSWVGLGGWRARSRSLGHDPPEAGV